MDTPFGFCDLCIDAGDIDEDTLKELLQKLYQMGYSTVALNRTVGESIFETEKPSKKSGKKNARDFNIPVPLNVKHLDSEFQGKLRILSRLTFVFDDPMSAYTLNKTFNLKKYDLLAVVPKTQTALQFACAQFDADIIFLSTMNTGLRLSRKLYLQAAERGIHFEIQYNNAIDTYRRKNSIYYSHLFHMYGKSKNIVITSGASMPSQIRSPYDVVNLASILGLNETRAKASILSQSRYLILKAEGRLHKKVAGVKCIQMTSKED